MSTQGSDSTQGATTEADRERSDALITREAPVFPRIELPPIPALRAYEPSIPYRDEPAATWVSPFPPAPEPAPYTYQVVPPPVPVTAAIDPAFRLAATTRPAIPEPVSIEIPATTPAAAMPRPQVESGSVTVQANVELAAAPASAAGTHSSKVAIGLLLVCAILLIWASRMAFSSGLLALGALLIAQLAHAKGKVSPAGSTMAARGLAVIAGALALLAARGAAAQLGEMAMVAGMFVVLATVPVLLMLAVTELVLRRRAAPSPFDTALRTGWATRIAATLAVLVAGGLAFESFTPRPDALVAFVLVIATLVDVFRTFRAAPDAAAPA